jgi:hypothetical protein
MTESPTAVTWPATRPPPGGGNGRVVVGAGVVAGVAVTVGVDFAIVELGDDVTAVVLGDNVVVPVVLGEVGGTVVVTDDAGVAALRTLPCAFACGTDELHAARNTSGSAAPAMTSLAR